MTQSLDQDLPAVLAIPATACLEATYGTECGDAATEFALPINTIDPRAGHRGASSPGNFCGVGTDCFFIAALTCFVTSSVPSVFTFMNRSKSAASVSEISTGRSTPIYTLKNPCRCDGEGD